MPLSSTSRIALSFVLFFALQLLASGLFQAAAQTKVFQSAKQAFRVTVLTEQLEYPWGLAFRPNGDLLITERPGRLRIFRDGVLLPKPVAGLARVVARGQGGLLDIALHPRFDETGWLYLSLSTNDRQGAPQNLGTRVIRYRLVGDRLVESRVIFDLKRKTPSGLQFGSRLAFDDQDYLYITVGDRDAAQRAQDPSDAAGSVLRLRDDGRVPADNPFVGRPGFDPAIFSFGHRNPQGLAFNPQRREIWELEHGPKGGDEVNRLLAGANYGWPLVSFGVNYSGTPVGQGKSAQEGLEPPQYHWTPSIAPSGMAFLTSEAYPGWKGNLFVGALKYQLLSRLELAGAKVVREEQLLAGEYGRIRDVRQGPDGLLYLLTDAARGKLLRLDPL
jgi:glucose/arabinose dehydrogenase|tara:strand:+ start:884 stop:2047 length:1164 start_codon:yes stop_codon:yes gene_type:complete